MIEVNKLTKWYGDTLAVDDVTFRVDEGEIVGLLGPNGAGKSTTMRILTCFLPATAGEARVAGHDVTAQPLAVRQAIGYLPENVPLYPEMRVNEYLEYRSKLKGVARSDRPRMIGAAMTRCGLSDVSRRVIGQLSKGYRQRVGLADCLVHQPKILILDEPTVGLDPNQIIAVRNLIKELSEEHTVLLSTHYLGEVEAVCERFLIIDQGRLAAEGRLDDLRKQTHLELEAVGPTEAIQRTLRAIHGVTGVKATTTDGATVYRIETKPGEDVREKVFDAIVAGGWKLRGLTAAARPLEELFVQITTGEAAR